MRNFGNLGEFAAAVGEELGTSEWLTITQARVDQFAEATDDHQWIHTDRERSADGPFGTTVAHGYLTLSLIPWFESEIFAVEGLSMALNYGSESVRFPSPVPVGSRVRAIASLEHVEWGQHGLRSTVKFVVEREGGEKPVCVARTLSVLAE